MKNTGNQYNEIDVLFINPRDLTVPAPYVKTTTYAALLLQHKIKAQILEPKASALSHDYILDYIEKHQVKILCISAFPSTLPDAYQMINKIKRKFGSSKIKIVLEGYQVNADPHAVLELDVDFGVYGDGEYSFLELIQSLLAGEDPNQELDGIIYNNRGLLKVNERAFIRNLNQLPVPSFELLPVGKYYSASTNKKYMVLFTDRGCPYNCSFCASAAQMKYRFLSVENVIVQLKKLVNDLDVEWVEFMDLTFTLNKRRTIEICKQIIEEQLHFDWACETRADCLDEDVLAWMQKAGCKKITIGVESGNEQLRIETGKKITDAQFKEVLDQCASYDIKVMVNYIFGHPNETLGTAWQTIKSSISLNAFNVLYTKMTPLPDVDLFRVLLEKGEIRKDLWYQYMRGEIPFPVYYPPQIGKWKMEFMYRLAFVLFYCRPVSVVKFGKMMTDFRFFRRSLAVWFTFVFGKTIYK